MRIRDDTIIMVTRNDDDEVNFDMHSKKNQAILCLSCEYLDNAVMPFMINKRSMNSQKTERCTHCLFPQHVLSTDTSSAKQRCSASNSMNGLKVSEG